MTAQIEQSLMETPTSALVGPVELRWGHFSTGAEAILNSLAHGLVPVVAIQGIRAIGGFPVPPESR